jgi:hypothetical protein
MKSARSLPVYMLPLLTLVLATCGLPQFESQVSPPTVLITAPAEGQQVQQGEQLVVSSVTTDARGVLRVELWVDGALIHTVDNPSPAPDIPFFAQQTWRATTPGSHSLMVIAYNSASVVSSPALANVTVTSAEPTPTPPPALPPSPGPVATATWTPIAVSTHEAPPPPPSPTPSIPPPPTTGTSPPGSGGDRVRPPSPGPITDFEDFGVWKRGTQPHGTFTQSSAQVYSGAYAGKLAYNFPSGGNDFVVFMQTHKLGGRPNQISAWIYGDGARHYINVWIKDAQGETWQFTFGKVAHEGWRQMQAWLDPAASWPAGHIEGPANGVIDYPVDFRALVLDDVPDSFIGNGIVYVDGLSCAEGSPPTSTPKPTTTPQPSPQPPGTPAIRFWADDYEILQGECTWLRWEVENVREVYLDGSGVVGHDQRRVCPTTTTTYILKVLHLDGTITQSSITIGIVTP